MAQSLLILNILKHAQGVVFCGHSVYAKVYSLTVPGKNVAEITHFVSNGT